MRNPCTTTKSSPNYRKPVCSNEDPTQRRKKSIYKYFCSYIHIYSYPPIPCENQLRRKMGTSLVVQWLRVHLPMQGTQVPTLVWEDPTCREATKPVHHNYWACALEPVSHNCWAHVPQLLKAACLEPVLCNKRSHCHEKPMHHNEE